MAPPLFTLLIATGALAAMVLYLAVGSWRHRRLVASIPILFVANPATPYRTLADVVSAAKANPGGLNYATAGVGSMPHLLGEAISWHQRYVETGSMRQQTAP